MDTGEGCLEEEGGLSLDGPKGAGEGALNRGPAEGLGGWVPLGPTQGSGAGAHWHPFYGWEAEEQSSRLPTGPGWGLCFPGEEETPREGGFGRGPAAPRPRLCAP